MEVRYCICSNSKHYPYFSADQGKAHEHAHKLVMAFHAWSYSTFHQALSKSRTKSEQDNLTDEFYQLCEEMVAREPAEYGFGATHVFMHVAKVMQSNSV